MWLLPLLIGCTVELGEPQRSAEGDAEVWIYTSMYEEVLAKLRPKWEAALPDIHIEVYQAGSEKVAQRYEAELAAGGSRACLLATSDPAWYRDLEKRGELLPFLPPEVLRMDRRFVDPKGEWVAMRVSLMVLAGPDGDAPARFSEMTDPKWKDKLSTPDPLASGTSFTTWTSLEAAYGQDFVKGAKANGIIAAGGNSSVLTRMESGERPAGFILLENLLLKPGTPIRPRFPEDGAVAIPGPLAITKGCPSPYAAERVYRWLFGPDAQEEIRKGGMHSPLPDVAPPDGAPPLSQIALFPDAGEVDGAGFKARWAGERP